jgi:hypothetical protein
MNVLSLIWMELIQDYQLFMTVKVEFVQVMKKDSLIAQEVNGIIITVVIMKMLLFVVWLKHQNQNIMKVNSILLGIKLNGTMMDTSLL